MVIVNFRLDAFHFDTGDLGKILEPFASAFFPGRDDGSLIYEEVVFNLSERRQEHEEMMSEVVATLRKARWVSGGRTF